MTKGDNLQIQSQCHMYTFIRITHTHKLYYAYLLPSIADVHKSRNQEYEKREIYITVKLHMSYSGGLKPWTQNNSSKNFGQPVACQEGLQKV